MIKKVVFISQIYNLWNRKLSHLNLILSKLRKTNWKAYRVHLEIILDQMCFEKKFDLSEKTVYSYRKTTIIFFLGK